MVPAAVALNPVTVTAPLRTIGPPLLAVRLKAPPLMADKFRPPLPLAVSTVLPVRLALPMIRLLVAVRLPDSDMAGAVTACAVMLKPLTAPATIMSPNRLNVPALALAVPVVRVPAPPFSCTPLPLMVPLLVRPVLTNCTRPLAVVEPLWLRVPPEDIVTVVGAPEIPDGRARLPVECRVTAPPGALSTALLMALPALLRVMPLAVTLIEGAVIAPDWPMAPVAVAFSPLTLTTPLRLMAPPLCRVRLRVAPATAWSCSPPAPAVRVVLPVRVTSSMVMPPLEARLPVSSMVAAVAACAPMLVALTDPATRLSAIRVVVPALVMVPVLRVPPLVLTLIATAPPPALMVPALVNPAALMPMPLALVLPPSVSAAVVVALSDPVPAAKVALVKLLAALPSVTPLPLMLMTPELIAWVWVTAPVAVRLSVAALTMPLRVALPPLCALKLKPPLTLASVTPVPPVTLALPVSVVLPSTRLPLALSAPLSVEVPVALRLLTLLMLVSASGLVNDRVRFWLPPAMLVYARLDPVSVAAPVSVTAP